MEYSIESSIEPLGKDGKISRLAAFLHFTFLIKAQSNLPTFVIP